jgi:4-hydroxy-4-methyl-2-oxoglutarate aldolase
VHPVPSTTAIADVLALLGEPGLVRDVRLGPVALPHGPVCGPAVTLRLAAAQGSFVPLYQALSAPLDGAVVVMAGAMEVPGAVFGQILARAARGRGAVGALVEGLVRDRADLHAEGLAVWGGPPCAVGPNGWATVEAVGQPVEVAGVVVAPGDLIVIDADGVVALPAARATELLALAQAYATAEAAVLDDLAAGRPLDEAYRHKAAAVASIRAGLPGGPNPAEGGR